MFYFIILNLVKINSIWFWRSYSTDVYCLAQNIKEKVACQKFGFWWQFCTINSGMGKQPSRFPFRELENVWVVTLYIEIIFITYRKNLMHYRYKLLSNFHKIKYGEKINLELNGSLSCTCRLIIILPNLLVLMW